MNKIRNITAIQRYSCPSSFAIVALAVAVAPASAQETTAAITGFVTDPSGAAVVGATVTATDTLRGTVWTTTTNEAGSYNLPRVPIGTYGLQVKSTGFQTAVHPPFTLILNQIARVDVQMTVGQIAQTVEVSGETPILQTQTAEVSSLIDANTASSLRWGLAITSSSSCSRPASPIPIRKLSIRLRPCRAPAVP